MPVPEEGYVLHTYGSEDYVRHAVATVVTLRRHDVQRPVVLFCPASHRALLEQCGLDTLFTRVEALPEAHQSIVGFKHHLHRFMPFERTLFIDADMVWCRNPDPLWTQLSVYPFTATGLERTQRAASPVADDLQGHRHAFRPPASSTAAPRRTSEAGSTKAAPKSRVNGALPWR